MHEKRGIILKILILVWTLMLLKVSLKCFLCFCESEVLEEIVNETVEDAVVMDQLPPGCKHWDRTASLIHTIGLLSFRQHGPGFRLLLDPTLEMFEKMISDPTEGLTVVHEATTRNWTLIDCQADLRRCFYKQIVLLLRRDRRIIGGKKRFAASKNVSSPG